MDGTKSLINTEYAGCPASNITVRDHIAIEVMNGLISARKVAIDVRDLSHQAYAVADAMIEKSNKP